MHKKHENLEVVFAGGISRGKIAPILQITPALGMFMKYVNKGHENSNLSYGKKISFFK